MSVPISRWWRGQIGLFSFVLTTSFFPPWCTLLFTYAYQSCWLIHFLLNVRKQKTNNIYLFEKIFVNITEKLEYTYKSSQKWNVGVVFPSLFCLRMNYIRGLKKMTRKIFYGLWNIMKTYWLLINLLTNSILTCSFWWFLNRRGEILFFLKK